MRSIRRSRSTAGLLAVAFLVAASACGADSPDQLSPVPSDATDATDVTDDTDTSVTTDATDATDEPDATWAPTVTHPRTPGQRYQLRVLRHHDDPAFPRTSTREE